MRTKYFLLVSLIATMGMIAPLQAAYVLPYPNDYFNSETWCAFSGGAGVAQSGQIAPFGALTFNLGNHLHLSAQEGVMFNQMSEFSSFHYVPMQGLNAGLYHSFGSLGAYAGLSLEQAPFYSRTAYAYSNVSEHGYVFYKIDTSHKIALTVNSQGKLNVYSSGYYLFYGGLKRIVFDSFRFGTGASTIYQAVLGTQIFGGDVDLDRVSLSLELTAELPIAGYRSGGNIMGVSLGMSLPLFGEDQENLKQKTLAK